MVSAERRVILSAHHLRLAVGSWRQFIRKGSRDDHCSPKVTAIAVTNFLEEMLRSAKGGLEQWASSRPRGGRHNIAR
jgi:hypothetical protein